MLDEKFLLSGFEVHGSDRNEFEQYIADIKAATHHVRCSSDELRILSYIGTDTADKKQYMFDVNSSSVRLPELLIKNHLVNNKIPIKDISLVDNTREISDILTNCVLAVNKNTLLTKGNFEPLMNEMATLSKTLIYPIGINKVHFIDEGVLTSLDRFGLKGSFLSKPNIIRDMAIEQELIEQQKPCTLVVREINGIKKIFSILSGKYTAIDQKILLEVMDAFEADGSLGKPVIKKWEINHYITSLLIEFPDKQAELTSFSGKPDKYVPGVWMNTSDTGDCSLRISGTWRCNNAITFLPDFEVTRKHIGEIDTTKIIDEVKSTIFADFSKLPIALCNLLDQDITDPSWDLTDPDYQMKNLELMKEVFSNAFKDLEIVKAVGIKAKVAFSEALVAELCPDVYYTAYDVASTFMHLPERVGGISSLPQLQKAVGKAPYISYGIPTMTIAP